MLVTTSAAAASSRTALLFFASNLKPHRFPSFISLRRFSSTPSPYPLYYELVHHRPAQNPIRHRRRSDAGAEPDPGPQPAPDPAMDRSKRKYYRKRAQRMFGGDSGSDSELGGGGSRGGSSGEFVELKPEVVDFPRLHAREQELYFYDAFAFPWEKDKHYRMVYQLEKKYFPEQSLDKAFVDPDDVSQAVVDKRTMRRKEKGTDVVKDERALVFFDDKADGGDDVVNKEKGKDVSQRNVQEFFKCLKKVPSGGNGQRRTETVDGGGEPFLVSRRTEMPPRWDGPAGTVVLVDKPKGWTSFTVCGKLRRLVKVQKVGHAGTLDPMATGLLIVCVGKATKLVERYQGMVKGYSGVFRLGEATSTWDADSPLVES